MRKNLGIRDAARRLGLAHTTVGRYFRANPELNRGSRGRPRVDLDELRRHRSANINPAMRGSRAGRLLGEGDPDPAVFAEAPPAVTRASDSPNYARAKAMREETLAQRARIDLDEKKALLVPRAEVEAAAYEIGALLQRDLLELGAQLGERLSTMTEPHEIVALLEAEHRRILATMSAKLDGMDWLHHENTPG